jgi:hypothetical protein
MKLWNPPELEPAQEIAEMPVELAKRELFHPGLFAGLSSLLRCELSGWSRSEPKLDVNCCR